MDSNDPGLCGVVGQCVNGNESFTKTLEDLRDYKLLKDSAT